MKRKKKNYDHEFKVQAVNFYHQDGRSIRQVAETLDISEPTLRSWINRLEVDRDTGNIIDKDAEINRLRRENNRLRMEREILKKATAFFAKDQS